jgi:HK97 family phage major capsid protein
MSTRIESENLRVNRMNEIIAEQTELENKKSLTESDRLRHTRLSAEFATLRAGVSVTEFTRARMAVINKEMGIEVEPVTRGQVEEWRAFIKRGANAELRTNYQSETQWGNVTAQTYDGGGGSGSQGATLVPASFQERVNRSLGQYDEVVDVASRWDSPIGSGGTTPEIDDTSEQGSPATLQFNRATVVDESFQSDIRPIKATSIPWAKVPTYRSGRVLFSLELDNDTFAPAVQLLEASMLQRIALAYGSDAVTNIVTSLPSTIQNVDTTVNTGVDHEDFLNLYKQLPKIYRKNAVFLLNDDTRAALTLSLEANARSLIGSVDEFLQRRLVVCNSLPTFGAGTKNLAIFVNPDYLVSRRVVNGTYVRRYMQTSIGVDAGIAQYETFSRLDFQPSGLFASAFPPVAVLNCKS